MSRTLYNQLKSVGATIKVIYLAYEHIFDVKLGPIDLGNIMELPRSEWDHHFGQEARK